MDPKSARKDRSQATEVEANRVLRDRSLGLAERFNAGFAILGEKMVCDLEEQLSHVVTLQDTAAKEAFVDKEVARLLRMLEKRKALVDEIQATMLMSEALGH